MRTHAEWMKWERPYTISVSSDDDKGSVPEFHWGMIIGLSLLWSGVTIGIKDLWTKNITKNNQ